MTSGFKFDEPILIGIPQLSPLPSPVFGSLNDDDFNLSPLNSSLYKLENTASGVAEKSAAAAGKSTAAAAAEKSTAAATTADAAISNAGANTIAEEKVFVGAICSDVKSTFASDDLVTGAPAFKDADAPADIHFKGRRGRRISIDVHLKEQNEEEEGKMQMEDKSSHLHSGKKAIDVKVNKVA